MNNTIQTELSHFLEPLLIWCFNFFSIAIKQKANIVADVNVEGNSWLTLLGLPYSLHYPTSPTKQYINATVCLGTFHVQNNYYHQKMVVNSLTLQHNWDTQLDLTHTKCRCLCDEPKVGKTSIQQVDINFSMLRNSLARFSFYTITIVCIA